MKVTCFRKIKTPRCLKSVATKLSSTVAVLSALIFMSECSLPQSKTQVEPCGSAAKNFEPDTFSERAFFLMGSPKSGGALCSFNIQTFTFQSHALFSPGSFDPILFQNSDLKSLVLVERFSFEKEPSRVTILDGKNQTSRSGFDPNVSFISLNKSRSLIAIGYDQNNISKIEFPFTTLSAFQKQKDPFIPASSDVTLPNESRPIGGLSWENTLFYISQGYDGSDQKNPVKEAKLLQSSSENHAIITKAWTIEDLSSEKKCLNAYSYTPINSTQGIVSCNPQYFGPSPQTEVTLFLLDVSNGTPKFSLLISHEGSKIQVIHVSGLSSDKASVLIEERKTSATDYTGTTQNRYWLDLTSKKQTPEAQVGGFVTHVSSGKYSIFSCVVAQDSTCEKNTWGIKSNEISTNVTNSVTKFSTSMNSEFLSFSSELISQSVD